MRRTTIYLDADLDLRLKAEARRLGRPAAEIIREAVRERLDASAVRRSRHAGAFSSGRADTASDVDRALGETGFGGTGPAS